MKTRLTAKAVADLTCPAGKSEASLWDDTLKGFGVRARASGDKTYVLQWKRDGVSKRIVLGPYEVLSADEARAQARKVLAKITLGEDPAAAKQERAAADKHTLGAVIGDYLEDKKKLKSLRDLKRYLNVNFKPLHALPVDKIARKHIAAQLGAIRRDHGDIVGGKARQAAMALFMFAMQEGLVEANPVIGTKAPEGSRPRERVLSDSELAAIWRACGDDDHGKIIRLLICLGARRQEIGGMAFSECSDLDGPSPTWTLPAERSKNKRKHTLPLLPLALGIIRSVPKRATRDRLFGTSAAEGFSGWDKGKKRIDALCGCKDWKVHDLRRSFATGLADLGVAPHVIEHILNHRGGHRSGVAGIYNRSVYERETRAALALWEDHVRALVEGGERKVLGFPQQLA